MALQRLQERSSPAGSTSLLRSARTCGGSVLGVLEGQRLGQKDKVRVHMQDLRGQQEKSGFCSEWDRRGFTA